MRNVIKRISFTDDPYYAGLRARVPNFVKSNGKAVVASRTVDNNNSYVSTSNYNKFVKENASSKKKTSAIVAPLNTNSLNTYHHHHLIHQGNKNGSDSFHHMPSQKQSFSMWNAKSYSHESGIGK